MPPVAGWDGRSQKQFLFNQMAFVIARGVTLNAHRDMLHQILAPFRLSGGSNRQEEQEYSNPSGCAAA